MTRAHRLARIWAPIVNLVLLLLLAPAAALVALWILGGRLADLAGQRRSRRRRP
jgi:hypothetical protein